MKRWVTRGSLFLVWALSPVLPEHRRHGSRGSGAYGRLCLQCVVGLLIWNSNSREVMPNKVSA